MTSQATSLPRSSRIRGLDLARGLAVIGMFAAHVLILDEFDWGEPNTWGAVVDGRSAATFALLAGVSIAIISGGKTPARGVALSQARVRIVVRAGLIFLLGSLLTWLGTNVYIILEYYAVMFLLSLPVLRWRPRTLFAFAAGLAIVAPVAQLVFSRILLDIGLFETSPFTLLVTGAYPAIVWFVFVMVGIGVGRLDLRRRDIHLRIMLVGVVLVIAGYTAGSLVATTSAGQNAAAAFDMPSTDVGLFDLTALLTALPHTGTPFEVVGATGFALALVALCLLVLQPGAPRVVQAALYPLAATGSMALSAYTVQIIVLALIGDSYWVVGQNNADLYLTLTLSIVLGCTAWALLLGRGPLERVLTLASRSASGMIDRPETPPPPPSGLAPGTAPDRTATPE
jgi:uncharacterized protein